MNELESLELDPAQVRRARNAVSLAFSLFGGLAGLWFVHIPVVAERLHLEPAALGLALLSLGLGSLIFQPVAGIVLRRIGSKPVAIVFHLASILMFTLAVNATGTPMMFGALFCAGASVGALNVAINTQASQVEIARGRPSMSAFHGFFSLGALVSAGLGGGMIAAGYGDGFGMTVAAIFAVPVVLWVGTRYLPGPPAPQNVDDAKNDPTRPRGASRFLTPALLAIVALAFIGNTVEFSVNDWSALFLHEVKGMTKAWAAAGFAMFSVAMAGFRFLGGPVVEKLGVRTMLSLGGMFIALGMATVVLSPWPAGSVLGFFLVGMGTANNAPLLVSQAAQLPGIPASVGVAATTTGLTAGFLLAPPIIGFVAQLTGLAAALGMIGFLGAIILVTARLMAWNNNGMISHSNP